jgi:serine/threonine-protein kinase
VDEDGTPFGRYRLVELLGRGGMGEVWRAYDPNMDRVVALKVLPPNFADDQVFQARFRREARSAAGLDEPHVVPIHDFGEIGGRLYVTMRLIKGRDLQALLDGGPVPPERAVKIIEQIASALHAAHDIGLVHRDVKPSNILVAQDDFAYLIDFGIARAEGETGLTSTGATIGTWAYMAPERFRTGIADASADTYALTCVLYQSLTGELPFPAKSLEQIAVAHMMDPPPKPSQIRPEVPAAMDDVIATGMAKDPHSRYATTVELAHAARDAITVPIPRPAPSPSPNPPSKERAPNRVTAEPTISEADLSAAATDQTPQRAVPTDPSAATEQADWTNQPDTQLAPIAPTPPPARPKEIRGRRVGRRTKIVAAVVVVAVAAVGVATVIIFGSQPDPTQRLLALVPSDVHCNPGSVPGGSLAYVYCDARAPQIYTLTYTMYADLGNAQGQVPNGHCPMLENVWSGGFLGCSRSGGTLQITWSIDSQRVVGQAVGSTGTSDQDVFQWWMNHYAH